MSDTLYWSTAGEEQTRLCGPVNGAPRGRRGGESRLESDCGAQHRKHRTTKTERGKASHSPQEVPCRFQSPPSGKTFLSSPRVLTTSTEKPSSQNAPTASQAHDGHADARAADPDRGVRARPRLPAPPARAAPRHRVPDGRGRCQLPQPGDRRGERTGPQALHASRGRAASAAMDDAGRPRHRVHSPS